MIGKFFVFISCCDCWCKEEYDINNFRFTGEDIPLNSSEQNEDEDKNEVKKIRKKNKKKFPNKLVGEILKEVDE